MCIRDSCVCVGRRVAHAAMGCAVRCAMTACAVPGAGRVRAVPESHTACCLAFNCSKLPPRNTTVPLRSRQRSQRRSSSSAPRSSSRCSARERQGLAAGRDDGEKRKGGEEEGRRRGGGGITWRHVRDHVATRDPSKSRQATWEGGRWGVREGLFSRYLGACRGYLAVQCPIDQNTFECWRGTWHVLVVCLAQLFIGTPACSAPSFAVPWLGHFAWHVVCWSVLSTWEGTAALPEIRGREGGRPNSRSRSPLFFWLK
eukprot:3937130-Rhodomonas_salina.1